MQTLKASNNSALEWETLVLAIHCFEISNAPVFVLQINIVQYNSKVNATKYLQSTNHAHARNNNKVVGFVSLLVN